MIARYRTQYEKDLNLKEKGIEFKNLSQLKVSDL